MDESLLLSKGSFDLNRLLREAREVVVFSDGMFVFVVDNILCPADPFVLAATLGEDGRLFSGRCVEVHWVVVDFRLDRDSGEL